MPGLKILPAIFYRLLRKCEFDLVVTYLQRKYFLKVYGSLQPKLCSGIVVKTFKTIYDGYPYFPAQFFNFVCTDYQAAD